MIAVVIGYMIPILYGLVIIWHWLAFIAEMIAWRRGTTPKVPWPDEVLWASTGRTLLDHGFFRGAPVRKEPLSSDGLCERPAVRARLQRLGTPTYGLRGRSQDSGPAVTR